MLQRQQPDRDQREHIHYWMNISATADNKIKAHVRNEAPEYSLGYREGQGDEDYSQKRGQTLLYFPKIDVVDALEQRLAHQNQNRSGRINRNHSGEWRQKEAGQKAKCGKHG